MSETIDVFEAIRSRRSIGRLKDHAVEDKLIHEILEAGNWAPSHHGTEPWRFYVMTGDGRNVLADAYGDIAVEAAGETPVDREKHRAKAFRAPLVIAVAVSPSPAPRVVRAEELAAAQAAVQNMLLAAHALGLAAIWRSGEPMYHSRMQAAFELAEEEELVALLYIGEPDMVPPQGKRRPYEEKTTWLRS
ncbi:nitroreductase [Paenibacillaceae bacterium]|nr:nitroreductase [Paenibacillaceae bacterium]